MIIKANQFSANEVIKLIREHTELTQKQFANEIHLSYRGYAKYETGERYYKFAILQDICKRFGYEIIIRSRNNHP